MSENRSLNWDDEIGVECVKVTQRRDRGTDPTGISCAAVASLIYNGVQETRDEEQQDGSTLYDQALRAIQVERPSADPVLSEAASLYWFVMNAQTVRAYRETQLQPTQRDGVLKMFDDLASFFSSYDGDIDGSVHSSGYTVEALPGYEIVADAIRRIIVYTESQRAALASEVFSLRAITPQHSIIPNSKLSNNLTKQGGIDLLDHWYRFDTSRATTKKTVDITCMLTFEGDGISISGRRPMDDFDRSVCNAVVSVYVEGDESHIFTPAMIHRAMHGLRGKEKPTKAQEQEIVDSIDKLRFMRIRVNVSDQLAHRRINYESSQVTDGEIDTYLIALDKLTVTAGGQKVIGYRVMRTPILYEYASALNEVITIPSDLVNVKRIDKVGTITTRCIRFTRENTLIRDYLLRRIEGMKNSKNTLSSKRIMLKDYSKDGEPHRGLYNIAGIMRPTRKEADRIRTAAEDMLRYWIAREYISGYDTIRRGSNQEIVAYEIRL